ncbi:MAG: hypothetical protein NUV77_02585 [Thermoguttaceae bacterium]|jgi:hypothetical protein|nr:hypothetical protein [Thermoguttaceae bacterium]
MKPADFLAIGLAFVAIVYLGGGVQRPDSTVIPLPAGEVQQVVAPVTAALAGHRDEARQLTAFYHSAAETVRRDGAGAKVIKSTAHLRTFCERAATLRFQGAFQKVPGLAAAVHGPDGALAKLLGLEVAELKHGKAADVLDAVAWACQEAAR